MLSLVVIFLCNVCSCLQEHDINVKKGIAASKVDPVTKQVHLSNGETIKFDKLFIATGSQ